MAEELKTVYRYDAGGRGFREARQKPMTWYFGKYFEIDRWTLEPCGAILESAS